MFAIIRSNSNNERTERKNVYFCCCWHFSLFHCGVVVGFLAGIGLFSIHLFESIYIAPASNDKYTRHHNHDDNGATATTTDDVDEYRKKKLIKWRERSKWKRQTQNAIKCNSINRIPVGYSVFFFVCSFDVLIVNCPSRKGFGFFLIWKKGEWGNFLVHKISSFQPCLEKAIILIFLFH